MAALAGIGHRNVIRRFAGNRAAVMTGKAGAADNAMVHLGRSPSFCRMSPIANRRCHDLVDPFTGGRAAVMIDKTGERSGAASAWGRMPPLSRMSMRGDRPAGGAVCGFAARCDTCMAR